MNPKILVNTIDARDNKIASILSSLGFNVGLVVPIFGCKCELPFFVARESPQALGEGSDRGLQPEKRQYVLLPDQSQLLCHHHDTPDERNDQLAYEKLVRLMELKRQVLQLSQV